jgi:beta-N-acetylhexosaminidase
MFNQASCMILFYARFGYLGKFIYTLSFLIIYNQIHQYITKTLVYMGPIMLDVLGTSLTSEDKELLEHPLVGGLILFTRNFESVEQLSELNHQIRKAAGSNILIAVDHEGGRVQRFREGFSLIPAMGSLLDKTQKNINTAKALAEHCGYVMATEVQACNIDILK